MLAGRSQLAWGLAVLAVALLALAALVFLLRGWGGGERSRVTAAISAEKGGSITSADGKLTLEIPPDALAKDTRVSVAGVATEDLPPVLREFAPSAAYRLEPDGLGFSAPVTVQLKLDPDERRPSGGVVAHLLFTLGPTGELEFLDDVETRVSLADGQTVVSGQMRHFSWLIRTDGYLEVKLDQIEPRERTVGDPFVVRAEVRPLAPISRGEGFSGLRSRLAVGGAVGLDFTIDPIFQDVKQAPRFQYPQYMEGAAILSCKEPGAGYYRLIVKALDEDTTIVDFMQLFFGAEVERYRMIGDPVTVDLRLDAKVTCVAPVPPPTPTSGIALPPTPTPTATPAPAQLGSILCTELFFDGVDIVPGQYHQGRIRVLVRDSQGVSVEGAHVFIRTEKSDGARTTAEGVTNANGYVEFGMRTTRLGRNTLLITNVEKTGYLWDVMSNQTLTWEARAP